MRQSPVRLIPWKTISSQYVMQTVWFNVRQDTCELPDGSRIDDYYVVERPNIVLMVAVTKDKKMIFNRQYKQGVQKVVREIPGGMIDAGEKPLPAARRELIEETGFRAKKMTLLKKVIASPTTENNMFYLFLATGLESTAGKEDHPRETIVNELIPLAKIPSMIKKGEINVMWTLAALYLASPYIPELNL